MATRLILELCGGEASEVVSSGVMPDWQRSFTLRPDRVKTLTAIDVPSDKTAAILAKLGFTVDGSGPWTAAVPPWRPDIVGEADLVEEVTRVFGFDNIPTTSLPRLSATSRPVRSPLQRRVPLARRALGARGMNEAVTWSFLARAKAERFGAKQQADLRLLNSIDATLDTMRPSILPNLIDAAQRNEARGLERSGAVRGRPRVQERDADGPENRRRRPAQQHGRAAQLAGTGARRRRLRRQGRCAGRPGRDRHADGQPVDPAGRARLVPSRPLGPASSSATA